MMMEGAAVGPYARLLAAATSVEKCSDADGNSVQYMHHVAGDDCGCLHTAYGSTGQYVHKALGPYERARVASCSDTCVLKTLKRVEAPAEAVFGTVAKSLEEDRYTLGLAYPADRLDGHGEFMRRKHVEKAAWGFMKNREIGLAHMDGSTGHGEVVESYVYRGPDWTLGDSAGKQQVIKSGDWMLGVVWDETAWPLVKSGTFDGFSMQGMAGRRAFSKTEAGVA